MTKILSVVWYKVLPPQFGGQKGIAQFNDFLSEFFPLTCICSSNNEPSGNENYSIKPLLPTSRWQVFSIGAWSKITRELVSGNYTHVILEHCYYGLLGMLLKKRYHTFLIIHSHNIEYQRFREMKKIWWPLLYWLEKKSHQSADLSLFKTTVDMEFAISNFHLDKAKCQLVPFGIISENQPSVEQRNLARNIIYTRHGISPGTKLILFMGTLDYAPNAEALRNIIVNIIPGIRKISQEAFEVIVCGKVADRKYLDLLELQDKDYCYAGFVEDIDNYFSGVDVFINPITSGGGIKVKLVEALSYGLPVVSTEQGATGISKEITGNQLLISGDRDNELFCRYVVESWNKPVGISEEFLSAFLWRNIIGELAERIKQQ